MAKKAKQPTFEDELAQLEDIVRQLDAEDIPLEEAISAYEAGVKLSLKLNQTLEEAQQKIEVLTRTSTGMEAKPLEENAE